MSTTHEVLRRIAADTGGEVIEQWNGGADHVVRVGARVAALSADDRDEEGNRVDARGLFLWTGWIDDGSMPYADTDTLRGGADEVRVAITTWLRS
ncbi:hypothetical protein ACT17_22565 [Mycolicibacterium conceptionense]|uniref:Uncharacterized protein n=1 Tax=Mycolicibacterium conceptionense TaxID=451644 RepID=A0A0J8U318_9MYCO|nr:hypothetical protein [Mycolicibacterium conceptionense]KMV15896.1 hypothetical protein ACT17_22565 [Mycolicibacterium conceptionense]